MKKESIKNCMRIGKIIEYNKNASTIAHEFKINPYCDASNFDKKYFYLNYIFKNLMIFEIKKYFKINVSMIHSFELVKFANIIMDRDLDETEIENFRILCNTIANRHNEGSTFERIYLVCENQIFKDIVKDDRSFYILIFSIFLKVLYSLNYDLILKNQDIFLKILRDFDTLIPDQVRFDIKEEPFKNYTIYNNCLLNYTISRFIYNCNLFSNNDFYIADIKYDSNKENLRNNEFPIINPIFIDKKTNSSKTIWILDSKIVIENGEELEQYSDSNFCVYLLEKNIVPKFIYLENSEENKNKGELEITIPSNLTKTNKNKLFKSMLPVQNKFIPLYLLEKELSGKINNTYIFGNIIRGSKVHYDGDKSIIIRDRIVPEIQYYNKSGKGKLY